MPPLVMVAAVARNGVIGNDNQLIWRLKSDLKHFRALTWGLPVIMGRKTYESIGKPLPGRETIVVTREPKRRIEGVEIAHSIDEALFLAGNAMLRMGAPHAIVAGGADIYRAMMPKATRLEITEIALEPQGDALFPPIRREEWRETRREAHRAGPDDEADFSFVSYVRR
ncbi:MAG TPA: dihydrofolate reductase [Beijerinckiaceae bacterium]|nr:dihydrofolate reductase [Beijerinckiaceae bacterium]